jgi:beta-phosphoglucomutase family hydrolase
MKLDHIGIEVQDLYTMELFYRTVLGFAPRYRYESINTLGLRTVFLERNGLCLELLERPRAEAFPRPRPVTGHLALGVADVDGECRRILATGFPGLTARAPRDTGDGFREAELRDPEGNVIELSARIRPEPRHPVRAVIFDLDGTLIDSEPNYYLADKELLARHGVAFSESDNQRYIGLGSMAMMRDLVRRHGLAVTPEALAEEKNEIYLGIAEHTTQVFPGMLAFLDRLVGKGLPVAVASGSAPEVIRRLLAAVGLGSTFAQVVSAEQVPHGKPAPDVFLETARRLGVAPLDCVVVEDSWPGVEAAHRAFMRCIAVPTLTEPPLAPAFALAELLFPEGMAGFDPDRAWAWLQAEA